MFFGKPNAMRPFRPYLRSLACPRPSLSYPRPGSAQPILRRTRRTTTGKPPGSRIPRRRCASRSCFTSAGTLRWLRFPTSMSFGSAPTIASCFLSMATASAKDPHAATSPTGVTNDLTWPRCCIPAKPDRRHRLELWRLRPHRPDDRPHRVSCWRARRPALIPSAPRPDGWSSRSRDTGRLPRS